MFKKLLFLLCMISMAYSEEKPILDFHYAIKEINGKIDTIRLTDGTTFKVSWWNTEIARTWKANDRLKLFYYFSFFNECYLENQETKEIVFGSLVILPYEVDQLKIGYVGDSKFESIPYTNFTLNNGMKFKRKKPLLNWSVEDKVIILHHEKTKELYDLWNITKNEVKFDFSFEGIKPLDQDGKIEYSNIFQLQDALNRRVLQQEEVVESVFHQLLNSEAGLAELEKPIGVFLFLGPSGVGKTELAKVLTDELYHSQSHLLRFDMSHFSEYFNVSRLIGVSKWYVNSSGGQLTEGIKNRPRSVVLLDEIEKAHAQVLKVFLPVFDEGILCDADNEKVDCGNCIFIMTSNLCSEEIIKLSQLGLSKDEILEHIEPKLIQALSPELYNRVQPIVFSPIKPETMEPLVDHMLMTLTKRILTTQKLSLVIDSSVKEYLIANGYHPYLGARPLKKMIENKVLSAVSRYILKHQLQKGTTIRLSYDEHLDKWKIRELKP